MQFTPISILLGGQNSLNYLILHSLGGRWGTEEKYFLLSGSKQTSILNFKTFMFFHPPPLPFPFPPSATPHLSLYPYKYMPWHMCGGQIMICEGQFSPSTMWVQGVKFRTPFLSLGGKLFFPLAYRIFKWLQVVEQKKKFQFISCITRSPFLVQSCHTSNSLSFPGNAQ